MEKVDGVSQRSGFG